MRIKKSMLSALKNTKLGLCKSFLLPLLGDRRIKWHTHRTSREKKKLAFPIFLILMGKFMVKDFLLILLIFRALKGRFVGLVVPYDCCPYFLFMTINAMCPIWPGMQLFSSPAENHRRNYFP